MVGSGVIQDKGLVSSVSRSGESSELLKVRPPPHQSCRRPAAAAVVERQGANWQQHRELCVRSWPVTSFGTLLLQNHIAVAAVQGPLYYCFVLILVTMLCWRETPAGLITISIMCGGDGLADIIGRRYGAVR